MVFTAVVALQRRNYADDRTESRALDPRGILGSILILGWEEYLLISRTLRLLLVWLAFGELAKLGES